MGAGQFGLTGSELAFTSTTTYANDATLPTDLKIQPPATLVFGYRKTGTPSAQGNVFGTWLNTNGAAQFVGFSTQYNAGGTALLASSSNATTYATPATVVLTPTTGVDYVIVVVYNATTFTSYAFPVNGGAPTINASVSWGITIAPVYTSTAQLACGAVPGYTRNAACNVWFGGIYNRALSATEAFAWARNPWQVFTPFQGVATLAASKSRGTRRPRWFPGLARR